MNLMKYKYLYFIISLLVIVPGIVSLLRNGLVLGIDFTGGSLLEVEFAQQLPENESISNTLKPVYEVESIQNGEANNVIIRGKNISNDTKENALVALTSSFGEVRERQFSAVGPTLSQELLRKTITAVLLVASFITFYIWRQFKEFKYGISAVIAMLHDTLVLIGIFSILGYFFKIEVDVLFVTALLTTLSFSVHDTIVVYDRIRELRRKNTKTEFETIVGAAVLETLSRSINNSMTIIIMLLSLVLLGGQSIQHFALALLIGAVTGTYSSTFTAAPLLLVFDKLAKRSKA